MVQESDLRSAKKKRAKERLKASFLDRLPGQIETLTTILASDLDEDLQDSIRFELDRMIDTSMSLELVEISRAARDVRTNLTVNASPKLLRPLMNLVRRASVRSRFAPIGMVVDRATMVQIRAQAGCVCEPILLFSTIEEMQEHPAYNVFQAEVIPAVDLVDVEPGRVVHVYGPSYDLEQRARALQRGASGYLTTPLRLSNALRIIRRNTYQMSLRTPRIVLLSSDREWMEVMAACCEEAKVYPFMATRDYLFEILEDSRPALLLLRHDDTMDCLELLSMVGASEGTWNLTSAVVCDSALVPDFQEAGAHLVLDYGSQPESIFQSLICRIGLSRRLRESQDLWTGLLDRSEVLHGLDRELARSRRTGEPATVAIIDVLGVAQMNVLAGHLVGESAFRAVGAFIQRSLREFDLVGHLGGDSLLVVLPGCEVCKGEARINSILERVAAMRTEIGEMAGMVTVVGVSDTHRGLERVLIQAEENLIEARSHLSRQTEGGVH